ncbi:hypothetical protein UJ101_00769 [Flavobacteriaceae bacterium UJ101]|nr:hypothetical protein UJ101_00769 [Flavobacteriaceae bacterium UJ101]
MIKKIVYTVFTIALFVSCGTHKKIVDKENPSKDVANFTAVLDQVQKTYIQDSTISFNSRLQYIKNGSSQPKVSIQTNIRNNELIWANASMIVPLGRALITPDGAKGYAKFPKKVYFDSDYSFIEDKIQLKDLEYEQIESLLTGRPLFKLNTQDYDFKKNTAGYVFTYKDNDKLIKDKSKTDVARTIELNQNFVVTKQSFTKPDTGTKVEVLYSDFTLVGGQYFPKKMQVKVFDKKNIEVNMEHKSIKTNTAIQTPFKLPTNYKKINF